MWGKQSMLGDAVTPCSWSTRMRVLHFQFHLCSPLSLKNRRIIRSKVNDTPCTRMCTRASSPRSTRNLALCTPGSLRNMQSATVHASQVTTRSSFRLSQEASKVSLCSIRQFSSEVNSLFPSTFAHHFTIRGILTKVQQQQTEVEKMIMDDID